MTIMECKITVMYALRKHSAEWLPAACPEGANTEYLSCETLPEIPQTHTVLLLTDQPALLWEAVQNPHLHAVYIGAAAEIAEAALRTEDIWPDDEPDELRKKRLTRLLRLLKTEYDEWFYEHVLLTVINSLPDMLWFKRLDGIHMLVNNEFCKIVRKEKDDVHGKDHFYIWNVPRPEAGSAEFACAESEEIAISTGRTYICDEIVQLSDSMKQLTTYKTPVKDMYGNVFGTVGIGRDVTDLSNLGIELSILVENLPFPTILFSADWKVVRMSSSFYRIAGTDAESSEDFDYRTWKQQTLIPIEAERRDAEKHSTVCTYRLPAGKMDLFYIIREQAIFDYFNNVIGHFCTLQDITYLKSYERSILEAANTDMLTGLSNRRCFYHYLNDHAEEAMTLLYMDLDRFKEVNDRYGHARGDAVLIRTAQLIRNSFHGAEAARLGGDEFAVLLPGHPDVQQQCEAMERVLRETFRAEGLNVTVSIGIVKKDAGAADIDRFIHAGDEQMYAVKKQHHAPEQEN